MVGEKVYYSVDDIMEMFPKRSGKPTTRQTVLKWANNQSLKNRGFEAVKQGKSWFFRKEGETSPSAKGKSGNEEQIAELQGKIEELKNEKAELKEKHLTEIKTITDKNDSVRQKLEEEKKETEEWAKGEREKIEGERTTRLTEVEEKGKALAEKEAKLEGREAKVIEETEANAQLKQEYDEGLTELEGERENAIEITKQARIEAEENVSRILGRLKGGTIGLMEKVAWMLTQPTVTRAYCTYICPDCHKDGSDNIKRVAGFNIPRLDELAPFGVCADCGEDQRYNRNLPVYLCDICPVNKLMLEASDLIVEALATVGVKADFNADGAYIPTVAMTDEGRKLTPKQQVQKIMESYGRLSKEGKSDS